MKEIINYKLRAFLKQPESLIHEYSTLLSVLKPKPTKFQIFHMKYIEVEDIKALWRKAVTDESKMIEIIGKVNELTLTEVYELKIIDFFALVNSVKVQLLEIITAENTAFEGLENVKFEAVEGGRRLQKYGHLNVLDELSNNDITKHDVILEMPFSKVFAVRKRRHELALIERDMNKLKMK